MSIACMKKVIELWNNGQFDRIILSNAYDTWAQEQALKEEMLIKAGINLLRVIMISDVTNTAEETKKLDEIFQQHRMHSLQVVADRDHLPRVTKALQLGTSIYLDVPVAVTCPKFEATHEGGWIKSVKSGSRATWWLWHFLLWPLTPVMVKKEKR